MASAGSLPFTIETKSESPVLLHSVNHSRPRFSFFVYRPRKPLDYAGFSLSCDRLICGSGRGQQWRITLPKVKAKDFEESEDDSDEVDDALQATIEKSKKVLAMQRDLLQQIAERRNLVSSIKDSIINQEDEEVSYEGRGNSFPNPDLASAGDKSVDDNNSGIPSNNYARLTVDEELETLPSDISRDFNEVKKESEEVAPLRKTSSDVDSTSHLKETNSEKVWSDGLPSFLSSPSESSSITDKKHEIFNKTSLAEVDGEATHLINNNNSNNNENDNDDDRAYLIYMPAMYSPSNNPVCMVACDRKFNRISEYPIPSELHLNCPEIVGSCNGLVCLAQYGNGSTIADVIYVWNPSIRKFKRLPDTSLSQYDSVATGFAYQCENNDYKVVKISSLRAPNRPEDEVEAEVYTLSSNSWRRVGISLRPNVVVSNVKYYSSATFVNKALHWLGYISEGDGQFVNQNMILSFDVDNDKFGEIALPRGQVLPQGLVAVPQSLMVFKGKLAFITFGYPVIYHGFMLTHTPCFIWVMGEYGVQESWNKLFSVQFENVIHVQGCTKHGELLVEKELKTESDDGELQRCNDSVIVSFDPETSHEKDLGIKHLPLIATSFMESLVLLDGAT